jgi:hypothetical protein
METDLECEEGFWPDLQTVNRHFHGDFGDELNRQRRMREAGKDINEGNGILQSRWFPMKKKF